MVQPSDLNPRFVADADALADVCEQARARGRLALDTEADSLHSYFHKLCLVQLSWDGVHAIIDPLALGHAAMRPLAELLADRGVVKTLHGADYDIRVLHRDLGVRMRNVRDTQVAAQLLGEAQTGLAALVEHELGITLDKRFQRADWGERPLAPELIAYAAGDTAFLAALEERLVARLDALGRRSWWEEECAALEEIHWEPPVNDGLAFDRVKGAARLHGAKRDRLAALHAWREEQAAAADLPPFRLLRNEVLLALADEPPANLEELAKVPGIGKSIPRRFGNAVLRLLAEAPAVPPRVQRARAPVDAVREARVRELRAARDSLAKELAVESGVLAPRALLDAVVGRLPESESELLDCLERQWRTEVLSPHLRPVLARWRAGTGAGDAEPL